MSSSTPPSMLDRLSRPAVVVALLLFVLVGVSATGYRTYRNYSTPATEFDWSARGHSDFHNGAYYPAMAFRNGVNPYSTAAVEAYPLARSSPIYSPTVFVWHLPFTFLELKWADVAFFAFNTMLLGVLAWLASAMSGEKFRVGVWLLVFGVAVFSRPGHVTLFTGYFTIELVIGTVVALHFATTRPFLSGCGMLLASGKPTYVLPLIVMMVCRRSYRAVAVGLVLCTIGGLLGLGWLASFSSPSEVLAGINEGRMALHDDPTEEPVNTWTRLDTVGVVSKVMQWKPNDVVYLVSMLFFLALPGWAIFKASRIERNRGATGLTALVALLAILVSIYHHSYDSLLIFVPWAALALFRSIEPQEMPNWIRWAVVSLLAVPAINYGSTRSFREKFSLDADGWIWEAVTSANGVCLLLALMLTVWCAVRLPKQHASHHP